MKCGNQKIGCVCCKKCDKICDKCPNPNCNKKKCDNNCSCKNVNNNWKTIVDDTIYKDNQKEKYDIVYLVQPSKHWNTNIYKIGFTTQDINKSNIIQRFKASDYDNYLKQICIWEVKNGKETEDKLIEEFKKNFEKYDRKKEYFIGDLVEIKKVFLSVISNEFKMT